MKKNLLFFLAALMGLIANANAQNVAVTALGDMETEALAIATAAGPIVGAVVVASVSVSLIPKVARWIKSALGR